MRNSRCPRTPCTTARRILYYPLSQFGDIIGIFRYQKPIGLTLDTDTLIGSVYCVQDKPGAQYKK